MSALGKNASCRTLVSLILARRKVPVPVALRLFLPDAWTSDPDRLARAGVPEPEPERVPRTKPGIALAELDRIRAAGVRFGVVLANVGYGISAAFHAALSARGLQWTVGIPRSRRSSQPTSPWCRPRQPVGCPVKPMSLQPRR